MRDFKKSDAHKSSGPGRKTFGKPPFNKSVERFQATCSECHKLCEVPFRPNGKKPVYCRDCFKGKEEPPVRGAKGKYENAFPVSNFDLSRQFDLLNAKLDQLIKATEVRSRS